MIAAAEWIFWGSVAVIVFTTIGYPLLLVLSWPFARRPPRQDDGEPTVSLIIAAFNEEAVIARKIANSLALDYPRNKLEIFVASDGSTDRTNEIVRGFESQGVNLVVFERLGKTGVQNRMAARARGEILVFSDANAYYRPDAIRKLVRNFADPAVAGVCGQLEYVVGDANAGAAENTYWNYERFLKRRESALSSVVGANGSIYAIRKSAYVPIDEGLISDFVEPLAIVRSGGRFIYEPEAVSVEESSSSYDMEFRRKVRILTRSIRGLMYMRQLMNPFRHGIFALQLLVHKLLRFTTPLFLATGILALVALAAMGRYQWLLLASAVLAAMSVAVGRFAPNSRNIVARVLNLGYYYMLTNFALVLAWRNVLRGERMTLWVPERGPTR